MALSCERQTAMETGSTLLVSTLSIWSLTKRQEIKHRTLLQGRRDYLQVTHLSA